MLLHKTKFYRYINACNLPKIDPIDFILFYSIRVVIMSDIVNLPRILL